MIEAQLTDLIQPKSGTREAARRSMLGAAALIGIALFVFTCWKADHASTCASDFLNFYTAGRLAFSGQIYSVEAGQHLEHDVLGCTAEGYQPSARPPYFAAIQWPLAQLPFPTALLVWRVLCAGAALAFVWIWPGPRWRALAFCAWSVPLLTAFVYGQDVPLLLLAAGGALLLLDRGHDFAAGVCLSLGAAKPHIFVIWVLLILMRRRWNAAWGLACGIAALSAISFVAGGGGWPEEFLQVVTAPGANPDALQMINLHGLAASLHAPSWLEALLALSLLVLLARACMRLAAPLSFALALAGGVLLGGYSYLYDLALCIPLVLLLLESRIPAWLKWVAVGFASPLVFVLPSTAVHAAGIHWLLAAFLVTVAVTLLRLPVAHPAPRFSAAAAGGAFRPPDQRRTGMAPACRVLR